MSSVIKVADSSSSMESHIFRCLVDDFKSLLLSEKEYRYEYDCGKKLSIGETVKLYFEITSTTGRQGKQLLEIRGGVTRLTKHSIILNVIPKLLNSDGSLYFEGASLGVNLRNSSGLKWDALQVQSIQNAKTVTRDNKCLIEFHVQLSIPTTTTTAPSRASSSPSSKSIAVTTPVRKQPSAEPAAAGNGKRPSESAGTSAKKIKLDQLVNDMQDKLRTDMETLLTADREDKDVSLEVDQDGQVLKAHSVILSARSQVFSNLLSDPSCKSEAGLSLKIPDLCSAVVKLLLHYLYTGSLPENWAEHTDQLLLASTKYELNELTQFLDLKAPELFTVDNAAVYLKMIKGLGLKNMESEMTRFFARNKDAIIKTSGFEELRGKNPSVLLDWLLN